LKTQKNKRRQVQQSIKRRLGFEKTVSTLSSRFASILNIDDAINASLADMGGLAGASRAYLFLFRKNGTIADNTHEWCAEGISPQINNLQNLSTEMVPWWMEKLRKGEIIHLKDVSKLPPEANAEKEILEAQDIKSLLVLPLYIRKELTGFIGFDNVIKTGEWSGADLAILRTSSEIIGNALERKRIEEKLYKLRNLSTSLIEALPAFFVALNAERKILLMNEFMLKTLGYTLDEVIGKDYLTTFVPESERKKLSKIFNASSTFRHFLTP